MAHVRTAQKLGVAGVQVMVVGDSRRGWEGRMGLDGEGRVVYAKDGTVLPTVESH